MGYGLWGIGAELLGFYKAEGNIANPENPRRQNSEAEADTNPDKLATRLDAERLKLIDEISRIIVELKKQHPELAQNLEKARNNIPANQEIIPVKNLMNVLNAIQQNLAVLSAKPELTETLKNLVGEAIKILQPTTEVPPENKLIFALLKNDFASVNIAIKNIIEQTTQQIAQPSPQPIAQSTVQTTVQPSAQPTTQPNEQPKIRQSVPIDAPQNTQPSIQPKNHQNIQPKIQQSIPLNILPNIPQNTQQQTTPQQITPPPKIAPQTTAPQTIQIPQTPVNVNVVNVPRQTFQVILNALQELKELGIPRELQKTPLKELEAIVLQKTGIEIPKDLAKNLSVVFNEKPVFAEVNLKPDNAKPEALQQPKQQLPQTQQLPQQPQPSQSQQPQQQQTLPQKTITATVAVTTFEIPLPKDFPLIPPPMSHVPEKTEMAFSLHKIAPPQNEQKFILQPWPASLQIPKEERAFWIKADLPLTPQILNIRDIILSFGKLPENPATVKLFAGTMHELSLQTEQGKSISKEQANLLWRAIQALPPQTSQTQPQTQQQQTHIQPQLQTQQQQQIQQPTQSQVQLPVQQQPQTLPQIQLPAQQQPQQQPQLQQLPTQITQTILRYQPIGNFEGELFKNLPEPVKKELQQELPTGKTWQPEILQKAVEKVLEKYTESLPNTLTVNEQTKKMHEEVRNILQNFKEQIQWTRIDQDTRPAQDRENVFYFMHNSELQKGRLKVKDERKGHSKKHQGSSISFSIETHTKNLGNVHADLTLNKNILNIRLQDEIGTASEAVKEERETLAKELADIGISLGELIYGKTPKIQNLPITKKEKRKGGFDVRV